jgi:hypothetical protein
MLHHLPGSLYSPFDKQFNTTVGSLVTDPEAPLALVIRKRTSRRPSATSSASVSTTFDTSSRRMSSPPISTRREVGLDREIDFEKMIDRMADPSASSWTSAVWPSSRPVTPRRDQRSTHASSRAARSHPAGQDAPRPLPGRRASALAAVLSQKGGLRGGLRGRRLQLDTASSGRSKQGRAQYAIA